jgi:DNA repair protein RecN (Recombination protein N)
MLTQLRIENYALIKELDISLSAALNIITGETGAGKSIMLGAVSLLLGKRADTKVLSDQGKKCIIEGVFNIAAYALHTFFEEEDLDFEEQTIIRREITPAGKSRAFINDTPVTLEVMKRLGVYLMDVHSQHDTLALKDNSFQLKLIDNFAGTTEILAAYQIKYRTYKTQQNQLHILEQQIVALQNEHDYDQFLLNELTEAKIIDGEQEELEQELAVLDNAEEIKSSLHETISMLSSGEQTAENLLLEAKSALHRLRTMSPKFAELHGRTESIYIELRDIVNELEIANEEVVYDPERIDFVKERLGLLYQLQQKHKVATNSLLLDIQRQLNEKVVQTVSFEEERAALTISIQDLAVELKAIGTQLSEQRSASFKQLKLKLENLLQDVGMPDATIDIKREATELKATGVDRIALLFSANKGVLPASINEVASGGELSRLMFCVKYILAHKMALPTIIFDEIDTGVSGEVAMKMGRMMSAMAQNHQVVTITHLPQIAAISKSHYYVYKDEDAGRAVSKVRLLNENERVDEIAMMIGGDKPSDAAYFSAKELIQT